MNTIVVNGYKSFVAKNFINQYNKKYKIIHYKKDVNNFREFKEFVDKNKFSYFIFFAGLNRQKCSLDKAKCLKTNYLSVKNTIDYFNKLNNKPFFIFISTSHIYGNSKKKLKETTRPKPKNLYAKLKLRSELYLKKNYDRHCILRLFNVYGQNQPLGFFIPDIIDKIKKKEIIKIDKSIRDFIHVDEVSNIINFIIKKNILSTINVGSGKGYPLKFIINKISKKNNIKPKVVGSKIPSKIVADMTFLKSFGYKKKKKYTKDPSWL